MILENEYLLELLERKTVETRRWPYPNKLKETRMSKMISRSQLSRRTRDLAINEPAKYVPVSEAGIKSLEMGRSRPRRNTAYTLAKALTRDPVDLFPLGFDDKPHNPTGITRIPPDRPKGGRPRKKS